MMVEELRSQESSVCGDVDRIHFSPVSTQTLTCRCRFCGYVLCYSRDDIGMDAQCPQCRQTLRLPGKLSLVATIIRRREKDQLAIAVEIIGFLCMFFAFPWGIFG